MPDAKALQACAACHADIASTVSDVHDAIKSSIQSAIDEAAGHVTECNACINGQIEQVLTAAATATSAAEQRVLQSISDQITQMYVGLLEHYPLIPSADEIAGHIISGTGLDTVAQQQLVDNIAAKNAASVHNIDVPVGVPGNVPVVPFGQTITIPGRGDIPSTTITLPSVGEPLPIPAPLRPAPPATVPSTGVPVMGISGGTQPCNPPTTIDRPIPGFPVIPLPSCPYPIQVTPGGIYVINPPPVPIQIFPPPVQLPPPPVQPPQQPQQQPQPLVVGVQPEGGQLFTPMPVTQVDGLLNFCKLTVCDSIAVTEAAGQVDEGSCMTMAGFSPTWGGLGAPPSLADSLNNIAAAPVIGSALAKLLYSAARLPVALGCWITSQLAGLGSCLSAPALNARLWGMLVSFYSRWLGTGLDDALTVLTYNRQYYCPVQLPSQGELNEIVQRGQFPDQTVNTTDSKTWECLTKALGNCPDWQKLVVISGDWQPTPTDALTNERSQPTCGDDNERMWRRAKVWNKTDRETIRCLNRFNPGPQQLAFWWTSQANNDVLAQSFGLDSGYGQWITSPDYALVKMLGMTEAMAKTVYRRSWTMPQGRMIIPGSFRFRTDSHNPAWQAIAQQGINVKDILTFDGVPAVAQDLEIEIRRPVLPVATIKDLYDTGTWVVNQVISALQDHGFTYVDADLIFQTWVAKQQPKGSPQGPKAKQQQQNEIIKLYEAQAVGRTEAYQVLVNSGLSAEAATEVLDNADIILKAQRRLARMKSYRRRFLFGDITATDANSALLSLGYDTGTAANMVDDWVYDLEVKHKEATAAQLCDWWKKKLISDQDYLTRLLRIGYTKLDAERIAATCGVSVSVLNPLNRSMPNVSQAQKRSRRNVGSGRNGRGARPASPGK